MNKKTKLSIVIVVCVLATSNIFGADMLDGYIGKFIAKADSKSDKVLAAVDDKQSQKESAKVSQSQKVSVKEVSVKEEAAAVEQKSKPKSTNDVKLDESKRLRGELKDSSIMSLRKGEISPINNQLQDVLSQLKSLSFSDEIESEAEDIEIAPELPVAAVAEGQVDPNNDDNSVASEGQLAQKKFKPTVLIPEDTAGVVDSFQLAESLFHIDDKVTALKFYRKAFGKSLPIGTKANPRRAWILFQIGNCLYDDDNIEAIKNYEKLIVEHPSSDWTNCARTKVQVLKWFLVEKPMELTMSEVK